MEFTHQHLLGKTNPSSEAKFMMVPPETCEQSGCYLLEQVCLAWLRMQEAASKAGISLTIVSAFRSFDRQLEIWENKWFGRTLTNGRNLEQEALLPEQRARLILRYSAMPGTSRHHWGTDLDLNSVEEVYFQEEKGKEEYRWLREHAADFGFVQPYTAKGPSRPDGYEEEKWHWSYFPLAGKALHQYNQVIRYSDISGFAGSESAATLRVIEAYVNGIDPDLKPGIPPAMSNQLSE
jgi:zinc D-Ala-D-Ala carboxypeptidase